MELRLDPQNAAFAKVLAGLPPPHVLGYKNAREELEMLQKHEPALDIMTETIQAPGEGSSTTDLVIFRPKSIKGPLPTVFYSHGGGWILGSPTSFAPLMEDLARQSEAALVFVCYATAPEKTFPYQYEQTYQALEYVIQNGHKHDLAIDCIVLAGDSVGGTRAHLTLDNIKLNHSQTGHISIAMMQMSIARSLPTNILQLILFYPVTDVHVELESYETFKDAPFLPADTLRWMINTCIPNKEDRKTALASPLTFLPDEIVARFPSTTIILASIDPLVEDGRAFGHRLQQLGVDAAVISAEGQMHAFVLAKPIRDSPTARAMIELAACKMRRAFVDSR
ncbi:vegetative specific protein H5 [Phaeosphaeria sp. MPI-PUGE-AT-0046c]|nr:vegetative specific protein H5 [Phaeosphaeria sp. MPI-PUGE-AT-0046c]